MDKYVDRYVAFIDILGFREHIKTLGSDSEKFDRLHKALSDMATMYPQFGQIASETGFGNLFNASAFSDNIVLSGDNTPAGRHFVVVLAGGLYLSLLQQGFLARGAITKGKLYHTSSIVLGDGLVKAYELESKAAIYPRVIIDSTCLAEIREEQGLPITRDFDGIYFLDVLARGASLFEKGENDVHPLNLARAEVVRTLEGAGGMGEKAKASWLARYFNGHAAEFEMEPITLP